MVIMDERAILFCVLWVNAINAYPSDQTGEREFSQFKHNNQSAQDKIDYSETLLKNNELHSLIPSALSIYEKPIPVVVVPTASNDCNKTNSCGEKAAGSDKKNADQKDSHNHSHSKASTIIEIKPKAKRKPLVKKIKTDRRIYSKTNKRVYISPLISVGDIEVKNETDNQVPKKRNILFGITKGTFIQVNLIKSATNIQTGLVILETVDSVVGYLRVMPAKTRLFASTAVANGSSKLFLLVSGGILTDDHTEFTVMASAFDTNEEPGLIARVISDGLAIERATASATAVFAEDILNKIPGNIATNAGSAAAKNLINEKKSRDLATNGRVTYIVQARPQLAIIQIEETF